MVKKNYHRTWSGLANALQRVQASSPAAEVFLGGIVPFKKTPINIAKTSVRYSPVGLLGAIYDAAYGVKAGKITAARAIDNLAAGLTGSGITLLGMALGMAGLLRGQWDDGKKSKLEKDQGAQAFALVIGGRSYTLDWVSPVAVPLFIGAELAHEVRGDSLSLANAMDVLANLTNPMFEMTVISGIKDAFDSYSYNGGNLAQTLVVDTAASYLGQAVPTAAAQLARTIDPVRRNAWYNDRTDNIPYALSGFINQTRAKLPGVSKGLPESVDLWGDVKEQDGNILIRAFNNMLSPGYLSVEKKSRQDQAVLKLYNSVGDASVLPSAPAKYITVSGRRRDLSENEYLTLARTAGQTRKSLILEAERQSVYRTSSDGIKTEVVRDIYQYANAIARMELDRSYQPSAWILKARELNRDYGVPISVYLTLLAQAKTLHPDGNLTKSNMKLAARSMGLSSGQVNAIDRVQW